MLRRALSRLHAILADDVVEPSELDEVRRIVSALNGIMKVNHLAVERMVQLVTSLRTFGRPDRAQLDHIDVRASIDGALTILNHELRDRVEVVREYGDVPLIACYPQQVGQVFMNLLVNAAQAIQGRGRITVRTQAAPGGVQVEIEDSGNGIADKDLASIFEPGFSTKGERVGMGLGLLIVRQVIDRHCGRISVRSVQGQGSTFTVFLPLKLETGGAS